MLDQLKINIKGFLESSFLDWPGQISAVIFLAGCNFRCPFCHNHGLVLRPHDYQTIDWKSIKARLSKFRGWIDGVVISGGINVVSELLGGFDERLEDLARQIADVARDYYARQGWL